MTLWYSTATYTKLGGRGNVKMMIWNGGHTARPVTKFSKDIAVLDKNHVLLWQIGQGSAT
jgi:hypothetical protein